MKITLYLDVTSSWCFWAQPAWEELKERYAGCVEFDWKIALMDASGIPANAEQVAWFYRRSGTIMRSPFMLNNAWFEEDLAEYIAPNAVAEAAKDFGVTDDKVRLAIARAGLISGAPIGRMEECIRIACGVEALDPDILRARAESDEIITRIRTSTADFHAHQISQRPAFVIEDRIGDKAVFSGIAVAAPLAATIDAMLSDVAAHASYAAHFGNPPQ